MTCARPYNSLRTGGPPVRGLLIYLLIAGSLCVQLNELIFGRVANPAEISMDLQDLCWIYKNSFP